MTEEGEIPEWVIPVIVMCVAIVLIFLIISFLITHPFIAGLLIGLVAGVGGTIIFYRARKYFKSHKIVEVEPPPED